MQNGQAWLVLLGFRALGTWNFQGNRILGLIRNREASSSAYSPLSQLSWYVCLICFYLYCYHLTTLIHLHCIFIHNYCSCLLVKLTACFQLLYLLIPMEYPGSRENLKALTHFQVMPVNGHPCIWIQPGAKWLRTDWCQKMCLVQTLELTLHFQDINFPLLNHFSWTFWKWGTLTCVWTEVLWPMEYFRIGN